MAGDVVVGYSTTTSDTAIFTVTAATSGGVISTVGPTTATNSVWRLQAGSANTALSTRDASDITRQIKERALYNEFKTNSTILNATKLDRRGAINPYGPGASGTLWLQQSNQFRLSYLFGKMKCNDACVGGAFNLDGILNFNSSGVQQGS